MEFHSSKHTGSTLLHNSGTSGSFCTLCHEAGHSAKSCAMNFLQVPVSQQIPFLGRHTKFQMRRQSSASDNICISWNKGDCIYPGSCTYCHLCAICFQRHRARDCLRNQGSPFFKTGQFAQPLRQTASQLKEQTQRPITN